MSRRPTMLVLLALLVAAPARATSDLAREALALCAEADRTPAPERRAVLERGLAAAERAVHADDRDADAHFAVFCNLGKRMRLDGAITSLFALRRLRRAVDRTLELNPDHPDALVGKAALLYYSPRLLGGDAAGGERLLRHALQVAPWYVDARLALARLLDARGNHAEARDQAQTAFADATSLGKLALRDEAAALVHKLGG